MTQNAIMTILRTPEGMISLRKFINERASELIGVVKEIEDCLNAGNISTVGELLRSLSSQYNRNAVEKILKSFFKKVVNN